MKCVLTANTDTGTVLRATVYFRDGKVTAEPATAADAIFVKDLLATGHPGNGKKITLADDPEAWFKGLPMQYHGTYLQAGMVKDKAEKQDVDFDKILQA
jgi:hypothetical protein